MKDRTPDMDDQHTIADMSGVRRSPLGELRSHLGSRAGEAPAAGAGDRFASELQDDEERLMVVLGTLKAALSVGLVYVIVFGVVIALMLWAWT